MDLALEMTAGTNAAEVLGRVDKVVTFSLADQISWELGMSVAVDAQLVWELNVGARAPERGTDDASIFILDAEVARNMVSSSGSFDR